MKCFHHAQSDAVGICTCCWKALCRDCAVDLSRGLACKDHCETEVRRLLDLRDFSLAQPAIQKAALRMGKMAHIRSGIMLLLMAVFFIALSFINPLMKQYMQIPAGVLALLAVWTLLGAARRPQVEQFRLCPHCGYNISGNTTNKCPECGERT